MGNQKPQNEKKDRPKKEKGKEKRMIDKKQENWRSCNTNPNTILKHSICLIKVIYILV